MRFTFLEHHCSIDQIVQLAFHLVDLALDVLVVNRKATQLILQNDVSLVDFLG